MSTPSRKTILLATDQQQSVLNALTANQPHPIAYSPYGHRAPENSLLSLLGFNGELPDSLTGHYHLGKGYRQFNPVLMRFNSPDSWSPFGEGGLNAYAYCVGDPINRIELDGHSSSLFMRFLKGSKNRLGVRTPSKHEISKKESTPINVQNTTTQTIAQKSRTDQVTGVNIDTSNGLTSAELNSKLNKRYKNRGQTTTNLPYKSTNSPPAPSTTFETPILVRHITGINEKLTNLQSARKNVSHRLISDSPDTRLKRQVLLSNIDSDIAELNEQVATIRSQNPAISV